MFTYFYKHFDISTRNQENLVLSVSYETKSLTAGHSAKFSSLAYRDRLLSWLSLYLADDVLRYTVSAGSMSNTWHTNTELTH